MTREEATQRLEELQARRSALVDQLTDTDASSVSMSTGGGSKSISNRSPADIKSKIRFLDREIANLEARLGLRSNPRAIKTIEVRFDR